MKNDGIGVQKICYAAFSTDTTSSELIAVLGETVIKWEPSPEKDDWGFI